jgi:hypothetical protein
LEGFLGGGNDGNVEIEDSGPVDVQSLVSQDAKGKGNASNGGGSLRGFKGRLDAMGGMGAGGIRRLVSKKW